MKRSIKKMILGATILAGSTLLAGVASADENAPASEPSKAKRGEILLPESLITGHFMRPQATVMVSRIKPELALVILKQAFIERITESVMKGPF